MTTCEVTIRNKIGLHARPAAQFVKIAEAYDCEVWVTKDGIRVNGKSILSLLTLAAEEGSSLLLEADGPGEDEVLKSLTELLETEEE